MRDEEYCFWHSPEHAQEAAEARRMGGLRRRREKTVQAVYEADGLETVPQIRRVVEIAVLDTLGLGELRGSFPGLLIAGALAASKLPEAGELEERMAVLEGDPEAAAAHAAGEEEQPAEAVVDGPAGPAGRRSPLR